MTALPAPPVDKVTADLLRLIDGDPIHAADRALIVDAIVQTARENEGALDPNALRAKLAGTNVWPNCIGTTIYSLRAKGVLRFVDYVETTGSQSGNNGRLARRYRVRLDVLRDLERAP